MVNGRGYHRSTPFFNAEASRSAQPFEALIEALRRRFAAGCEAPARQVHEIVNPLGEAGQDATGRRVTSLPMPAWIPGQHHGVKIVNIAPGNARRGLPGLRRLRTEAEALRVGAAMRGDTEDWVGP